MASQEIQKAILSYENYISVHGIDEQVIDAYCQATQTAIAGEKDIEYGLKVSKRAKKVIEQFVTEKTGGTIWDLDFYCHENRTNYDILDKYYEILKYEAQNKILDSYC